MRLEFSRQFSKNTEKLNFLKFVQGEQNPSMRANGKSDVTKLVVAFRNFANVPTIAR